MDKSSLAAVLVRRPSEIIEGLVREFTTNPNERVEHFPSITVYFGVHRAIGIPAKMDDVNGERWLVLYNGAVDSPADGVTFVPLKAIESLTIHRATDYIHLLNGGKLKFSGSTEIPTKFAIERRMQALAKISGEMKLSDLKFIVEWRPGDQTSAERFNLNELITALEQYLKTISKDSLALDEFAKLSQVVLRPFSSDGIEVSRQGGMAIIQISDSYAIKDIYNEINNKFNRIL